MFEKLEKMLARFNELTELMGNSEIIANQTEWQKLVKEHSGLQDLVDLYLAYKKKAEEIEGCKEMLDSGDKEMMELAQDEIKSLIAETEKLQEELKIALLPKDPDDDNNVVIEIRAGAGGDEAALFGTQLARMYMRYAERHRLKIKEIDMNYTELGGVKEVTFSLAGKGCYKNLKFESGVHRVQRIPATESQGRVHTSTVTVAVLPEVEDVAIAILDKDIKVDTYRSSGAGGQHVNKTESAIRITHFPSGLVVTCQDEKSQIKNRETAMKVLKTRLYDFYKSQADKEYSASRKSQIGSGDRSERIRTYNFPQGRITDHRIGFTLYSLENFLDGDIDEMIEELQLASQNALLSNIED